MDASAARATTSPTAPRAIVSKVAYAKMRQRDPSAVSYWIRTKKLTPPALVGGGRNARIDVELADRQLGASLDLGQQLAQATTPFIAVAETPEAPALATVPRAAGEPSDQARLLKAKADQAELESAQARIKAAAQAGTWIERAGAEAAFGRQLAQIIEDVERWFPDLAKTIADAFGGDHKLITSHLRAEFRKLRGIMAAAAGARAAADLPAEAEAA
jgi:hypothetical protein